MGLEDDEPIEHRWITASIENAQKKVEGHNFNIRKNLLEYDDVMNLQRKAVYELRRRALHGENIRDMMLESLEALVADILDETVAEGLKHEDWDTPALLRRLEEVFDVRWTETPEQLREFAREEIREKVLADVRAAYAAKEAELGDSGMRQVERMLVLQFADQLWKDHLLALDRLRDGIGLRGYAQRNPLLEYKKEAFGMFQMMNSLRDEAVLSRLLRMRFESAPPQDDSGASLDESDDDVPGMVDDDAMEAFATREDAVIFEPAPRPALPEKGPEARLFAVQHGLRRNDPCPCGSGQKFKKCCYEEAEVTALTARFAAAMEAEAQAEAARLASLQDTDGGGVAEGVSPSAEEGETSNDAPADVVDAVFATPSGETTA
ncbi:MAG: hypothetical protein RLZZ299_1948, partial [Pseudomonadota bacterium]